MTEYAVPFNLHSIDAGDERAVLAALRHPTIARGPRVTVFEDEVAAYTGHRYAVAVCHGTCALRLILMELGFRQNGAGKPHKMVRFEGGAPYDGILHAQKELVSRERSLLTSLPLEHAYAQVFSSWFGEVPAKPPEPANPPLALDAARALGNPYVQLWETVALSFHPLKTITTGEGGMVLTNDEGLAMNIRGLRSNDFLQGAGNYWMTDFQAALGLSQLHRIDDFLTKRRTIAYRYIQARIVPEPETGGRGVPEYADSAWNVAPWYPRTSVTVTSGSTSGPEVDRSIEEATWRELVDIQRALTYLGVETVLPRPLLRDDPKGHYVMLPIYPSMTDDQVERVIAVVLEVQARLQNGT